MRTLFGSDAEAAAPEGVFLKSSTHPRAYGNFARFLGKYVRDEKVTSLQDAIRRLTSLPASNLKLRDRGRLAPGMAADVVTFDPATIADHSTYANPMQYATGVRDVFVNGVQVLKSGEPTGATSGRFVKGPGWTGWPGGGACKAAAVTRIPRGATEFGAMIAGLALVEVLTYSPTRTLRAVTVRLSILTRLRNFVKPSSSRSSVR